MKKVFSDKQMQILNVAEELIAKKGFDGTSVRDISTAAKVNVAMISYYFGSKEKLLDAVIINRISGFRMILENLQLETISPIEKIKKFVSLYINRFYMNKDIYQIIQFEIINQKRTSDFPSFNEIKQKNLELLEKIISEGQNSGVFKSNCNTYLIPAIVVGTFSQIYNNKKFYFEMMNLNNDQEFENYILNDFTEEITNVILGMLIK